VTKHAAQPASEDRIHAAATVPEWALITAAQTTIPAGLPAPLDELARYITDVARWELARRDGRREEPPDEPSLDALNLMRYVQSFVALACLPPPRSQHVQ
jgi:hypothetical protein